LSSPRIERPSALTTPVVTVCESPNGLPIAITVSPIMRSDEVPSVTCGSSSPACTRSTATSESLSAPTSLASNSRSSASVTSLRRARSTRLRSTPAPSPWPWLLHLPVRRHEVDRAALDRYARHPHRHAVADAVGAPCPPAAEQVLGFDVLVVIAAEGGHVDQSLDEHVAQLDEEPEGCHAAHESFVDTADLVLHELDLLELHDLPLGLHRHPL